MSSIFDEQGAVAGNAPMEQETAAIGQIPEPAAASTSTWKLPTAIGALGAMLIVGGFAVATNPWSLVVLRSRSLFGVALATAGGLCCNVALFLLRPALPFGRAVREVSLGLTVLATAGAVLLGVGIGFASIFKDELAMTVLRVDGDTAVARVHQQYGLGPDSSCVYFEVREGTGWSTRYRQTGECVDAEKGWTATLDGDVLTLEVSRTSTCTYRVDGPGMSLQPLVTEGCEAFVI
ncbi:MAG: hypothetical protein ABMA25_07240 [Ilumatobacteraceae bacterium]